MNRFVDLFLDKIERPFRAQRPKRRLRILRIARNQILQLFLKALKKRVSYLLMKDEPFSGDTTLSRVVYAPPDAPFDGRVQISIVKHDKGIATTKFHRALLERLTSFGSNGLASSLAACQGNALDSFIRDRGSRLLVRDKNICINTHRRASISKKLFKRQRALRHI